VCWKTKSSTMKNTLTRVFFDYLYRSGFVAGAAPIIMRMRVHSINRRDALEQMIMASSHQRNRRPGNPPNDMGMSMNDSRIGKVPVDVGDAGWGRFGPSGIRVRMSVVVRSISGEAVNVHGISVPGSYEQFMGMPRVGISRMYDKSGYRDFLQLTPSSFSIGVRFH